MANKVLTFVVDTAEGDLGPVIDSTVSNLQTAGHTVSEVRVMDDTGETKMTVPEPTEEPTAEEAPAEEEAETPAEEEAEPTEEEENA